MRNVKPKQHVKHAEGNVVNAELIIEMIKTIVVDVAKTKDVEMTVVEAIPEVTVISAFHIRPRCQNFGEKRRVWIEATEIETMIVIAELIAIIVIEKTEMFVIVALSVDRIENEIHADEMKEETPKNLYESKR